MKNITNDISKFAEEELCQIYNNLNCWDWDELLGEKPKNWDKLPLYHRSAIKRRFFNSKSKIANPLMAQIEEMVSLKKLLEWHWIHNLCKTKEEYEAWLFERMANGYLRQFCQGRM